MVNLFYDAYSVLCKVYFYGAYIDKALYSTAIEPLNKAKTVKICYGVLDKDLYLEYFICKLCERSPKQKIKLIVKIGMYAIRFLGKKPFAVIDSAVELTKKLGKAGNAGFVNAVLRKFCVTDIALPENKTERLSVEYSTPLFAVEKLISEYGFDTAEKILSFDKDYNYVRFPLSEDGAKYLTERGYEFESTPFKNVFSVKKLAKNEDFDSGVFTFQSIGSVAICDIVGGGEKLFDACAAPGGKSCALSQNFSSIVAAEIHEHRAELIRAYLNRMKVENVTVSVSDSSVYNQEFLKCFDAVLCDVPCSCYGTIKDNPDVKLRKTAQSVLGLFDTQLAILNNCSRYVSDNGFLIYSTCSIFNEENDLIIERFLLDNPNFKAVDIVSPINSVKKNYGLQFLPHISMGAGFYCAKLKKIG